MPDAESSLYYLQWRKRDGSAFVVGTVVVRATSPDDALAQFTAKYPSTDVTRVDAPSSRPTTS